MILQKITGSYQWAVRVADHEDFEICEDLSDPNDIVIEKLELYVKYFLYNVAIQLMDFVLAFTSQLFTVYRFVYCIVHSATVTQLRLYAITEYYYYQCCS